MFFCTSDDSLFHHFNMTMTLGRHCNIAGAHKWPLGVCGPGVLMLAKIKARFGTVRCLLHWLLCRGCRLSRQHLLELSLLIDSKQLTLKANTNHLYSQKAYEWCYVKYGRVLNQKQTWCMVLGNKAKPQSTKATAGEKNLREISNCCVRLRHHKAQGHKQLLFVQCDTWGGEET